MIASASHRCEQAWAALEQVPDPEVPAVSLCELGIVRHVQVADDGVLEAVLTPTYSGCPATELIEEQALTALNAAGVGPSRIVLQRAPAWTTDWISEAGREKLRAYGIAPPNRTAPALADGEAPIHIYGRRSASVPCPRCGSDHTEQLSAFGSTACKALHRCLSCQEPFEHFKPI